MVIEAYEEPEVSKEIKEMRLRGAKESVEKVKTLKRVSEWLQRKHLESFEIRYKD